MEGSEVRTLVKQIIQDVIAQAALTSLQLPNLSGVVSQLNGDGTVTVATALGVLSPVFASRTVVLNENVLVISGGGKLVLL